MSREEDIPHHEALDRIALREGYKSWSLLSVKQATSSPAGRLFSALQPGDLLLVGARPGQGKTLMGLQIGVEAMKSGSRAVFFTLEYTQKDALDRFQALGVDREQFDELFEFDCSDAISAGYILRKLASASRGTVVVIDYLQLLDQKRDNPELAVQVRTLKSFARDRGLIMVFISQIDRSYDASKKPFPDLHDIRLPNPVDLRLFNKTCFLSKGGVQFSAAR